jgi:hypothetical protein
MKTLPLIILSLFFVVAQGFAQSKKNTSLQDYKDFVLDGDRVWALTKSGNFNIFDINTGNETEQHIYNGSDIAVVARDANGSIVIANNNHHIKGYLPETKSWLDVATFKGTPLNLMFNSRNEAFLVTDQGVVDLSNNRVFKPEMDSMSFGMKISSEGWATGPSACLMDSKNNIWLGFNFGEWGGDLYVFNTNNKQLRSLSTDSSRVSYAPVHAVFEAGSRIYVTAGSSHLGGYSGRIAVFENYCGKKVFNSFQTGSGMNVTEGVYVGAGAYNLQDNNIYFYSQKGLFKGELSTDLSKIEYWEKVFNQDLLTSKCRDNVYERVDVRKMGFSKSGNLIFLSKNNRIGIYNGKTIKLLQ